MSKSQRARTRARREAEQLDFLERQLAVIQWDIERLHRFQTQFAVPNVSQSVQDFRDACSNVGAIIARDAGLLRERLAVAFRPATRNPQA